jgi:hypothetical protein
MALNDAQRRDAGREIGVRMFHSATANLNLDDMQAAVTSIDTAMETVINTIPAGWQAKTIKQALIDNLPEPFRSRSTAKQKAEAMEIWAKKEAGVL